MDSRYLFRGKRVSDGEWAYGACSYCEVDDTYFIAVMGKDHISYIGCHQQVDPKTIGQCAGISAAKSYRGERAEDLLIFEGDVLREGRYDFTVVYDRNWAKFKLQHDGKCIQYPEWNRGIRMEIISTMHDSQEGAKPE